MAAFNEGHAQIKTYHHSRERFLFYLRVIIVVLSLLHSVTSTHLVSAINNIFGFIEDDRHFCEQMTSRRTFKILRRLTRSMT